MSKTYMSDAKDAHCAGGGKAASGTAGWLIFAASPTFALMSIGSAISSSPPDMLCISSHGNALNGMAAMYALMSVFHLAPWLGSRRLKRRDSGSQ